MSTRAVIARAIGPEGAFKGVYSHSDGYPTWLGTHLWKIIHVDYRGDLAPALRFLVDQHTGWSIAGEVCYCHPSGHLGGRTPETEPNWFTHENTEKDIEWVYIFDEENNRLFVRDTGYDAEEIVDLSGAEPNWEVIECAEDLSRCSHYAWRHKLVPKTCNLSTQTWLGRRPLEFHDAIAFIVGGKRFKSTGSGGNSDYLNGCARYRADRPFPPHSWIATVKAGNGRSLELPVASTKDGKYVPLPGVTWIYPATKDNPQETVTGGVA